jgi:hypothetical protein
MDKNEELQKWLNDDRYIRPGELAKLWGIGHGTISQFLQRRNIFSVKTISYGRRGHYVFYNKAECLSVRPKTNPIIMHGLKYSNANIYLRISDLALMWGISEDGVRSFIRRSDIRPIKFRYNKIIYDRAECERARPFINQPEQKEVEKVEEKQMELPEPKEQTPDIIPADTIDLFTMSELETELKNRGVELTAEVRAKINASDMPEMKHIATMLRGNAKTIAIRLSVLNDIAGQLAKADERKNITKKAENVLRYAAQKKSLRKCDTGVLNSFGYLTNNQAFEAIRPFITKSEALEMPCFANSIIKAYLSNNKTYVVLWDKEVVQEFIANEKTKLNLIESIRPVVDCIPDQKINTITDSDGENKLDKILSRLNEIEYQIVYHENFGPSEDIINHFKSAIQSRSNVLSALMSRAKIVIHNESCVILLDQKFAVDKVGESKSKETINNALMDIGCKDFNIYVLFSGKQDVKNNQEK